jgi:hypothetical protein
VDILGGRKYVEIAGARTHELPPLLVRSSPGLNRLDRVLNLAEGIVESEDMVAPPPGEDFNSIESELERRRYGLALNLVDEYRRLVTEWKWGDSILDWIRQCELTFETRPELRNLLHPDLWPHAGRSSFVLLLEDKALPGEGVDLESAVGLRLTFRQPPPISCFSNQFLFYLKGTVAASAYHTWAGMSPEPVASFPPERFHFEIVDLETS